MLNFVSRDERNDLTLLNKQI